MTRRSPIAAAVAAVAACALTLCFGTAAASAQGPATTADFAIEHDDSVSLRSGFFGLFNYDSTLQPDAQRQAGVLTLETLDSTGAPPGPAGTSRGNNNFTPPPPPAPGALNGFSWEKRRFVVAPGEVNGSFTVDVRWGNPSIDFDLYVYRERADGTLDPAPIASSASGGTTSEKATYVPSRVDTPVAAGAYWVYVDNWCSRDNDPVEVEFYEDAGAPTTPEEDICEPDSATVGDEDDWIGSVSFAPLVLQNRTPVVTGITGPTTGRTDQLLSFTAAASDPDGTIRNYTFDLDGDGRFEYDNGSSPTVTTSYDRAGVRNVGVRVIDDRGGVAYASTAVSVTGRQLGGILQGASLSGPVFGGRKGRKLVVRYRLRETGKVTIALYRGAKRVRRLVRGRTRTAGKLYKVRVRPRGLKRGGYTVRISVRGASGGTQKAKLIAQRL